LTVTLLRCENDLVGLELKGLPDDVKPVLVARDDMGGRLKKDSAMITRIGDMTAMYKACGRIAKIEIFLPVEFVRYRTYGSGVIPSQIRSVGMIGR